MDKNGFLIDLSESNHTEFGRVEFSLQRPEQRVFSAIWALESQVNNGGFVQYFVSHDGDTATFAAQALLEIGALRCAAIVSKAVKVVAPNGVLPAAQTDREDLIESLPPEALEQLEVSDSEFFAYPDNLTELLYEYVHKHVFVFGIGRDRS
jgi:hypothetical protein